jgi:hypothetical protein
VSTEDISILSFVVFNFPFSNDTEPAMEQSSAENGAWHIRCLDRPLHLAPAVSMGAHAPGPAIVPAASDERAKI